MSKARIIEAVKNLDLETTTKLLHAKPSLLTVKNRQGRNLMHLACSASCATLKVPPTVSVRLVKFLIKRGAKVRAAPGGGLFAAGTALDPLVDLDTARSTMCEAGNGVGQRGR